MQNNLLVIVYDSFPSVAHYDEDNDRLYLMIGRINLDVYFFELDTSSSIGVVQNEYDTNIDGAPLTLAWDDENKIVRGAYDDNFFIYVYPSNGYANFPHSLNSILKSIDKDGYLAIMHTIDATNNALTFVNKDTFNPILTYNSPFPTANFSYVLTENLEWHFRDGARTTFTKLNLAQDTKDRMLMSSDQSFTSAYRKDLLIDGNNNLGAILDVDEERGFIYQAIVGTPDFNTPINIYRYDLNMENQETWTSPAGIGGTTRFNPGLYDKETGNYLFLAGVSDAVSGKSTTNGNSLMWMEVNINQDNFAASTYTLICDYVTNPNVSNENRLVSIIHYDRQANRIYHHRGELGFIGTNEYREIDSSTSAGTTISVNNITDLDGNIKWSYFDTENKLAYHHLEGFVSPNYTNYFKIYDFNSAQVIHTSARELAEGRVDAFGSELAPGVWEIFYSYRVGNPGTTDLINTLYHGTYDINLNLLSSKRTTVSSSDFNTVSIKKTESDTIYTLGNTSRYMNRFSYSQLAVSEQTTYTPNFK